MRKSPDLALLAVMICFLSASASAQQVYKWTDEKGRTHYSNEPARADAQPAALPELKKENIDARIKALREATPETCEKHGGIDCSAGPDSDGSVICLDRFKDAVLPHRFYCLEARLRVSQPVPGDETGAPISGPKPERASALLVTVRNMSDVRAEEVQVSLKFPLSKTPSLMQGPAAIEPYGIGEYIFALAPSGETRAVPKAEVKASCRNCSSILERVK